MVIKIIAIALLVGAGALLVRGPNVPWKPLLDPSLAQPAVCFRRGHGPVVFAYGGWQTASFVAGEMKDPRRNLPRALVLGSLGVALLYISVIMFTYMRWE